MRWWMPDNVSEMVKSKALRRETACSKKLSVRYSSLLGVVASLMTYLSIARPEKGRR